MRLLCSVQLFFPQKPHGLLSHAEAAPAASVCAACPSHTLVAEIVTICVLMRRGADEQARLTSLTLS